MRLQLSLEEHGRARTRWQGEESRAAFVQLELAKLLNDSSEYCNDSLSSNPLLGKGDFLHGVQVSVKAAFLQCVDCIVIRMPSRGVAQQQEQSASPMPSSQLRARGSACSLQSLLAVER